VSTDLITDQRVSKVCNSLMSNGYAVYLVGRQKKISQKMEARDYECKRFKLWFNKGFLFYANLNIRLFFFLLFNQANVLLANDLDTLPANYLVSKLKAIPLVYDSHEYFTEVPELENRNRVKKVWERLESFILPKLNYAYTVSQKIAVAYKVKYGTEFKLVRNFPIYQTQVIEDDHQNVILYQGALNIGRGLEELIEAMRFVDSAKLWIVGAGDIEEALKQKSKELGLENKIEFLGRMEPNQLKRITMKAKLGVSLEKQLGLNYAYALPNKIFDYIHAGTPVLYSSLEEVVSTLKGHQVGEELKSQEPKQLAQQLNQMLNSEIYDQWVSNCKNAAKLFNWQKEEPTLLAIFDQALSN